MKKIHQQILKTGIGLLSAAIAALIISSCASNKPYGEDFDIPYPHPSISSFTSSAMIGTQITISGSSFKNASQVFIGSISATLVDTTDSQIIVQLPRVLTRGQVKITNKYQLSATSAEYFEPQYPSLTVTGWPSIIYRGTSIKLEGENVDQIKEISINGQKVSVDGSSGSSTSINVSLASLTLTDNSAVIKITSSYGGYPSDLQTSPSITVKDVPTDYDPVAPVVLFDFEDGVDPYVAGTKTSTHGINNSVLTPKARGDNYLTVKTASADGWTSDLGSISATNINLSGFTNPCLTFLINTNGSSGYFQMEITQGSKSMGGHFTSDVTGVTGDSYKFTTNGWEWRSISLKNYMASLGWDWDFDATANIDLLKLNFKQGNGSGFFEVNLDQIMITDGLMGRNAFTVFNFEDGNNPFSANGGTGALNGNNSVTASDGDKYLNVTYTVPASSSWNWIGSAYTDNGGSGYDISTYKRTPYVNFWINTGGNTGYVQLFANQNGNQYVTDINSYNPVETNGDWVRYSIKLDSDHFPLNQYATNADPSITFNSFVKITGFQVGFTTGQVAGSYEVNLDDVIISEGPMF